jgi:hypothetical protein
MEITDADRGKLVEEMLAAIGSALEKIPDLVTAVIQSGAWRQREHLGVVYLNTRFVDFITSAQPRGCGWPLARVEALLLDDPVALALWREATTHQRGGDRRTETATKNDIVRLDPAAQGNSKAYGLSRLRRERPDLFAQVEAGAISVHAACIEAGFRKRPSTLERVKKLLPQLTSAEWAEIRNGEDARREGSAAPAWAPHLLN